MMTLLVTVDFAAKNKLAESHFNFTGMETWHSHTVKTESVEIHID